jgi:hypothetical protein
LAAIEAATPEPSGRYDRTTHAHRHTRPSAAPRSATGAATPEPSGRYDRTTHAHRHTRPSASAATLPKAMHAQPRADHLPS